VGGRRRDHRRSNRSNPIEHRQLGRTGVSVSKFCLGAMMFGAWGNPDHDESIRIIHAALDASINFVDTADVYGDGESEEIVAKALANGRRDDVVLAKKFYNRWATTLTAAARRGAGSSKPSRPRCAGSRPSGSISVRCRRRAARGASAATASCAGPVAALAGGEERRRRAGRRRERVEGVEGGLLQRHGAHSVGLGGLETVHAEGSADVDEPVVRSMSRCSSAIHSPGRRPVAAAKRIIGP
jgi:Aldo/keto reductase family